MDRTGSGFCPVAVIKTSVLLISDYGTGHNYGNRSDTAAVIALWLHCPGP